ncbi:hypothetical protein Esti_000559 [Eimeria stiedai]
MLFSSAAPGAPSLRRRGTNGAQQQRKARQQPKRKHAVQQPSSSLLSPAAEKCTRQQQQQQRRRGICLRMLVARAAAVALLAVVCCCSNCAAAGPSGVQAAPPSPNLRVPVTRRLRYARPHPMLALLSSSPSEKPSISLLQSDREGAGAPEERGTPAALSPLLKNLPGRLRLPPGQQQLPYHVGREEGLSLAMAMPLCELPFEALAPKLGGGTYGVVHPLKEGPTAAACREVAAAAAARSNFAVKVFRLRNLASLIAAAEEGQRQLSAAEKAVLPKVTTYLRAVNLMDDTTLAAVKAVLSGDEELEKLRALQEEKLLSPEAFLENFAAIRAAIHTKCFLDELEETGLIFWQIGRALKEVAPNTWSQLQDASEEKRVSSFAALGRQKFHWSLPLARVLAKDNRGRLHWGLLVKLFDGDMEASHNTDGSALDGWEVGSKNAVLKDLFTDKKALIAISAKAVKPFVFMHNYFFFGHFDIKPANLLYSKRDGQASKPKP